MDNYSDLFRRRINRYGYNQQTRIQGRREREFESLLKRSIYRVNFFLNNKRIPAILKPMKQDKAETLHYLLVRTGNELELGTILQIPGRKNKKKPWMIFYMDDRKASGYNRYVVLRMTHNLGWWDQDHKRHNSWAQMFGQQNNLMVDMLKSRSRFAALYSESVKGPHLIMPINQNLQKDSYLTISQYGITRAYRVTGTDIQSTGGVMYVTLLPVMIRDESIAPEPQAGDQEKDFFWLEQGFPEIPGEEVEEDG